MASTARFEEKVPTKEDLRAEIARLGVFKYVLAAKVGCHPGVLGQMLQGTAPIPDEMALKIAESLDEIRKSRL